MNCLKAKLQSEGGASILLALLMFLVCAMVGASVLAAAASNAGKARSNRTEQQSYLTLSSAIRLVADELEEARYMGKYRVWEWETPEEKDGEGNVIKPAEIFFYMEQVQGSFTGGHLLPSAGTGTALIPLRGELDAIFNQQLRAAYPKCKTPAGLLLTDASETHTLTVTLPEGLDGYPASNSGPESYRLSRMVTVRVKLDHSTRHILLTAWVGDSGTPPDKGEDTMTAELVAKVPDPTDPSKLIPGNLSLDYSPMGRTAEESGPPGGTGGTDMDAAGGPLQWELNWIKKGVA